MKRFANKKRGQIWVETVIYTLIGIAIIGIVLAVAKPKIDQKKDEVVIEQAIESLGKIDDKIYEVQRSVGNRRSVDLRVGNGALFIDMDNDQIYWEIDSSFEYSEENTDVSLGRITVKTERGDPWKVILSVNYGIDLSYNGDSTGIKEINSAPTPYKLTVENLGVPQGSSKLKIDIREV